MCSYDDYMCNTVLTTLFESLAKVYATYDDRMCNTIYTLSIRTPKLLTILVLKFEKVYFTTLLCLK